MQSSIYNDVQSSNQILFTATASALAKPSVMNKPSYSKTLVMNASSRPDMNRSHSQSALPKPSLQASQLKVQSKETPLNLSYNKPLLNRFDNSIKPATKSFVPKFESKIQKTVPVNSVNITAKNINSGKINTSFMEQMHNLKSQVQNSKSLKEPSFKAVVKEEVTFSVEQNNELKDIQNFMDKAIKVTPENIMKSVQDTFKEIMTNPQLKDLKRTLAAAAVSSSAIFSNVSPALALQGNLSYTRFMEGVNDHLIKAVSIAEDGKSAMFLAEDGGRGSVQLIPDPDLINTFTKLGIDLSVQRANVPSGLEALLPNIAVPLLLVGLFFLFSRGQGGAGFGGGQNPMQMGKSKARISLEPDTGTNFDSVAGVDEAKEELEEIVDFLKNPTKYSEVGAKIPSGALLIGPPGTGKTLLAKAVAGEAGVPFLSISAAEFIEMFVGVGASRVRDLFGEAKKNAPCIIFIDELDAVGRQRAQGQGMGNDEREQTINQLLTEMDGFEKNAGIIVLAATNIPEVLDKALLRPGRFDRQIQVGLPDSKGRETILKVHCRDKKLNPDVTLKDIAKRCLGMSGADLANVMNEAAIFSARSKQTTIRMQDIYDAIDRIQIGMEKKGAVFSDERQKLVSYHEAGHAILGAVMEDYDLVSAITIVPRGGAGGVTIFTPDEETMESGMYSKAYLLNRICVGMGGRIAEEIINGKNKVTTGASNDFQQVTNTAKMMVEQMGMSDVVGPRNVSDSQASPMQRAMGGGSSDGPILQNKIDDEIDRILNEQYERGMKIMTENRPILDQIAKTLIEQEKMNGLELLQIIQDIKPELIPEGSQKKLQEFVGRVGQTALPEPAVQPAAMQTLEPTEGFNTSN